uniref:Uncharacterized protein n=2 Tax=Kalmanozyma brasiliensis (strain GHG001) TaxID=1365824 RepID=V5EVW4_KALBG
MATSAVPSIAAFLEDQLQDHSSAPFFHHGVHESPTRRSRLIIETLPSSLPDRSSPTKAHAPHAPSDADEEIDVSTPRARPTTSSTIGITGTIFHHDDEITDSEDASPARNLGSSRIVVPLEQRRRLLDEADGEATPTRTSAMHNAVQRISRDERELQGRRQESTVSVDSFESSEGADRGQDMVQSPTAYADDEDYVTQRRKGGSQNDSDQDADESQTDGSQSEEEAEEEEEEEEEEEDEDEEEEEEEEDDEDEDEDDLALEALDLEGY